MPNSRYYKARSERGRMMANARWAADRERRDAEMPARIADMELREVTGERALREGDLIGALSWQGVDGVKRKWVVRQGRRRNGIAVDGVRGQHGFSWLIDRLRRHLSHRSH